MLNREKGFGCQDLIHDDYYDIAYYDYQSMADFGYIDQQDAFDRNIKGNTFRIDLLTDFSFGHGGFLIRWECMGDLEETTTFFPTTLQRLGQTTFETTTTMTTSTTTTMVTTTTTSMTVTTTLAGTQPTGDCDIVLVLSSQLCDDSKQNWSNEETKNLFPRYARFHEVKMFESQWRTQMDTWYIGKLTLSR